MKDKSTPVVSDGKFALVDPTHIRLAEIADEMLTIRAQFGEKYLELCKWVRTKALGPAVVREVLAAKGFAKSRISEINRISQCPDEMWKEFEARRIGRETVLLLERGADQSPEVLPPDMEGAGEDKGDGEVSGGEGEGQGEKTQAEKDEAKKNGMKRAAHQILKCAEFFNLKKRSWTLQNGWVLELRKESKAEMDKRVKRNGKQVPDEAVKKGPF
jgi:hypothetical protein